MARIDGFQNAIEALQAVDAATQQRILSDLQKRDPKLAEKLKENLLRFEDLQYLLAADFKIIWWECPRADWYLALRNASEEIRKMLKNNLSTRAFAELEEQIIGLGPQSSAKVQQAQKEICTMIRKLAEQGRMALPRKNSGDGFV